MLRIATFNLRCDTAKDDGANHFRHRLGLIGAAIRAHAPQVLCFQEMTPTMLAAMRAALPEYAFYGHGRGPTYHDDEHNPIAILHERLQLHALDTQWLSPTPHQAASRYPRQSPCPRIVTWARLYDPVDQRLFTCFNTHLDHQSASARRKGLNQILALINQYRKAIQAPVFLCGDFNFTPASPLALLWQSAPYPLNDLSCACAVTFHDFYQGAKPQKIDYILTGADTAQWERFHCQAWQENKDGLYLSDHYPLSIDWQTK